MTDREREVLASLTQGLSTSRVVFPDLGVSRSLMPFGRTTVEFTPERSGEFGFACGMNMVHDTLLVEPNG